jgi:hypothetical protein
MHVSNVDGYAATEMFTKPFTRCKRFMKSITIKFCLLFSLVFINNSFSQQDSLADVFPLAIGKRWIYSFNTFWQAGGYHYAEKDTGIAEYQIIGSINSVDSIRWQFLRKREFTRYRYSGVNPNIPPVSMSDNNTFEIVEFIGDHRDSTRYRYSGVNPNIPPVSMSDNNTFKSVEFIEDRHELYASTFDMTSVFPFWRNYADSARFYRYVPINQNGDYSFNRNAYLFLNYNINLILSKDIGVMQSTGRGSYSDYYTWNYILDLPLYHAPHLKHSKFISISALTGLPSDTAITIINDGTDPVTISSITSSDKSLVASFYSSIIPSTESALLSLHCISPKNGTSSSKVIIMSSSTTSPDTIDITIQGRMEAILKTNKQINFGNIFFSRKHLDTTISIINTGNIPLVLDSVNAPISSEWLAYPLLTWDFNRRFVNSGDTAFCKIGLELTARDRYQNTNFSIYSNSKSSPDVIHFSAPICGGAIIFGTHSLSFAADVNGLGGGVLYIVATLGVEIVQRGQPSNPAFKTPNSMPIAIDGTYYNKTYTDTILFIPQTNGVSTDYIIYSSHSTCSGDTIAAIDTVWLSGVGIPINTLSTNIIEFGNISVGKNRDTILTISNMKDVPQEIIREIPNPDPSIQIAMRPIGTIGPYLSYNDTIRFVPISEGQHSCVIYYHFLNADVLTKIDSVRIYGSGIIPNLISLRQNYPNPFNPGTIISFEVPLTSFVSLKVFDLLGREVATLVNEELTPGSYEKPFDGSGLASGVYLYRLQSGSFMQTKKLLLLR